MAIIRILNSDATPIDLHTCKNQRRIQYFSGGGVQFFPRQNKNKEISPKIMGEEIARNVPQNSPMRTFLNVNV